MMIEKVVGGLYTDLETTLRAPVAIAILAHRSLDDFRDKRLGQATHFRVNSYCSS